MPLSIRREKDESKNAVSAQVFPEGGHPSSPMVFRKEGNRVTRAAGEAVLRWARMLKRQRGSATLVIKDTAFPGEE